jgi:hypothetical protein
MKKSGFVSYLEKSLIPTFGLGLRLRPDPPLAKPTTYEFTYSYNASIERTIQDATND